jgi:hypothetical protein
MGFLEIWAKIHRDAPTLKLKDVQLYARSILKEFTLPFFEQFRKTKLVEKHHAFIDEYSSLSILWRRGVVLFPLKLITYEIIAHDQKLFEFYASRLRTGAIQGTTEDLFNLLFHRLINMAIPLTSTDLLILKSFLAIDSGNFDYFNMITADEQAKITQTSIRTVQRRLKFLYYSQIPILTYFLDMGALGYESILVSHFEPIPHKLAPYTVHSVDMTVSRISLIQIPTSKGILFDTIQSKLSPIFSLPLSERIHSWNLSGLAEGKEGWKLPPQFIFTDPKTIINAPSPQLKLSLLPDFDPFRALTKPDFKILDLILTKLHISSMGKLSREVKVTVADISRRMKEYYKARLLHRTIQFFNIGLDLSIYFYISAPADCGLNWPAMLSTFPKVDIYSDERTENHIYFGFLKLANEWSKPFANKVSKLKQQVDGLKFYYTLEPASIATWNILLQETYPPR